MLPLSTTTGNFGCSSQVNASANTKRGGEAMEPQLSSEVEQFLRSLNSTDQEEGTSQDEPKETIHVYFVREEPEAEPEENIVEAIPVQNRGPSPMFTVAIVSFYIGLLFSSIALQVFLAVNPPVATITIVPRTQIVTLNGTLPLGRLLPPIRLFQTQTTPTTGRGHQSATTATGEITVYNGQSTEQVIPAGTIFTGSDGVEVATDATITVPAGSPPTYGSATVSAHAASAGARGNIAVGDINTDVAVAVIAKNTTPFSGGQDERTFPIVTKRDVDATSAPMKPILAHSMLGALQGELRQGEELLQLPCLPTVESNHQPGDEASQVQVTVSQTCNGVAYDDQALHTEATQLLTAQALKRLGPGYTLVGRAEVMDVKATFPHTTPALTFYGKGTWVYGLSETAQEHMKQLIAGKTKQQAVNVLLTQPGIKSVSMEWDEQTKLPKDTSHIHFIFLVPNS